MVNIMKLMFSSHDFRHTSIILVNRLSLLNEVNEQENTGIVYK